MITYFVSYAVKYDDGFIEFGNGVVEWQVPMTHIDQFRQLELYILKGIKENRKPMGLVILNLTILKGGDN